MMTMAGVLDMATKRNDDSDLTPSPFGRKMKLAREKRGWSQTDLAARANVSRGYVGLIEAGHRNKLPKRDEVVKVAQAFAEDVSEWLRVAGFDVEESQVQARSFEAVVDTDIRLTAEQKHMLKSLYISFTGVQPPPKRKRRS
jgi:transcriptional regulator with XRE-family HTH domain